MWVAQLNRLPTKDRLVSWGLQIPSSCPLCSVFEENREHLLLRCSFANQLWHLVQSRLRLPPYIFITWTSLIAWTKMRTESAPPLLRKIVAQATVYQVWKQRNNIVHNGISLSPWLIFKDIDREVRNTISARRLRKHFKNLMILWIR